MRIVKPPRHYNPPPMFGLRVKLSRTAQVLAYLLRAADERGIERERIAPLLYMADVLSLQYLGRPMTEIEWRRDMLEVAK